MAVRLYVDSFAVENTHDYVQLDAVTANGGIVPIGRLSFAFRTRKQPGFLDSPALCVKHSHG